MGTWTIHVNTSTPGWERLLGDSLVAYLLEGGDLAAVRVEFHETEIPDINVKSIILSGKDAERCDRTNGELDAAILAYRADPSEANRERCLAAQQAHHDAFLAEREEF